ncbi:MAG: phosphoserine phosphatase SerB [Pseudomonadota bacterium]
MATVVCLIADPARRPLDATLVERARRALPETEIEWLSAGEALELGPVELEPTVAQRLVRDALDAEPVDVCALPFEGRRKRLLLCDMDSTIIEVECIDELADALGLKAEIAEVTRRTMNGEIPFEQSLPSRVELLAGLPETTLSEIAEGRTPLTPGATTLVRTMRANGAASALVSGGFTYFTRRVRERVGFDIDRANVLELRDGKLTGKVVPPLLGQDAKVATLAELRTAHGLGDDDVLAVGDGANDIPMLQAAGLGVAFRAHQTVRAAVPHRLDVADLTGVLFLQGYRREQFVEN